MPQKSLNKNTFKNVDNKSVISKKVIKALQNVTE